MKTQTPLLMAISSVLLFTSASCQDDWEANNRPATLVFAGSGNNTTFWGKKS